VGPWAAIRIGRNNGGQPVDLHRNGDGPHQSSLPHVVSSLPRDRPTQALTTSPTSSGTEREQAGVGLAGLAASVATASEARSAGRRGAFESGLDLGQPRLDRNDLIATQVVEDCCSDVGELGGIGGTECLEANGRDLDQHAAGIIA